MSSYYFMLNRVEHKIFLTTSEPELMCDNSLSQKAVTHRTKNKMFFQYLVYKKLL